MYISLPSKDETTSTSSVLYTKALGKNEFYLLWTEITGVIFSMIKVTLQQLREPERNTTKRELMTQQSIYQCGPPLEDRLQRQFLSNGDVICRTVTTFLGQLHFMRNYFFTANTSAELVLFQSNQFNTTDTFSEELLLQSSYFFKALISSQQLFFQNSYLFGAKNVHQSATS